MTRTIVTIVWGRDFPRSSWQAGTNQYRSRQRQVSVANFENVLCRPVMLSPSRERQRRRVFAQRKPVLSNNAVEATLTRQWPIRTNVATQPSALGYLILTVEYYVARSLASPSQVSKPTAFCQAGNLCGHPLSKTCPNVLASSVRNGSRFQVGSNIDH